jgi:hypothetical protein
MKLLETYPTDIYVSDVGYLIIEQDLNDGDGETRFLISPEQTRIIFSILPALIKEQEERWVGVYVSPEQEEADV